jgi:hypothetical protein
MTSRSHAPWLTPWAGLILGSFGWWISHAASAWVFDHCPASWPALVALVTIIGLAIAAVGLWLSWHAHGVTPRPRRFVALTSIMSAGGFILAILFQFAAALIIPRCLT